MSLDDEIVACRKCPRLVEWREHIAREKRRAYAGHEYWGKPIPNFGDPAADRLIVGLAPAAHGANRTGRIFTGDRSGDWLYRALYRAGLANQAESVSIDDGLVLQGVYITAVVHCAPPENKPTGEEIAHCRPYLVRLLEERSFRAILCLGGLAWREVHRLLNRPSPPFSHGTESPGEPVVLASYHPSQQNTFTRRLTEEMLDQVVARFART